MSDEREPGLDNQFTKKVGFTLSRRNFLVAATAAALTPFIGRAEGLPADEAEQAVEPELLFPGGIPESDAEMFRPYQLAQIGKPIPQEVTELPFISTSDIQAPILHPNHQYLKQYAYDAKDGNENIILVDPQGKVVYKHVETVLPSSYLHPEADDYIRTYGNDFKTYPGNPVHGPRAKTLIWENKGFAVVVWPSGEVNQVAVFDKNTLPNPATYIFGNQIPSLIVAGTSTNPSAGNSVDGK